MSAPWRWRDPGEAVLLAAVSAEELMTHARTIAQWERDSGSPGEARADDSIDLLGDGLRDALDPRVRGEVDPWRA